MIPAGSATSAGLGNALSAGDVNGDGNDDLLMGASSAASNAGVAWLLLGPDSGVLATDAGGFAAKIEGTAAGDKAGFAVFAAGDFDGDGMDDVVVGAPYAGTTDAGAAALFYGPVTGTLAFAAADSTLSGSNTNAHLGFSILGLDADADGRDDLVLGAPGKSSNTGAVYVWETGTLLGGALTAGDADVAWEGSGTDEELGYALAGGDLDGAVADGFLIVSGPGNDDDHPDGGIVYAVPMDGSYTSGVVTVDAAITLFNGSTGTRFGSRLASGFNLDGPPTLDELIVSNNNGEAFLFYDALAASSTADADAWLDNPTKLGSSLATVRDLDADGYDDLVAGAPYYNGDSGRAYWIPGSTMTGTRLTPAGGTRLCAGPTYEGRMGWSVAAPDLDGDGADDLLVGAPWAKVDGGAKQGLVFAYYADTVAAWKGDTPCHVDTEGDLTLKGEAAQDFAGWSVADAGDLNQDGEDDLLVGAYGNDTWGVSAGAAYVVLASHLVP